MNILLVSGFGSSKRGKESFKIFCSLIDSLLHKAASRTGIDTFFYTYRKIEDLDDFVFNLSSNKGASEQLRAKFQKNFEKLDMIFIDGKDKGYMPWSRKGKKLVGLIELCIQKNKSLFAGGIGMLSLIYFLAVNKKYKNFINQNGEYPTIENINDIPYNYLCNLKHDDTFLDFATGDVYEFDINDGKAEWSPIINVGIHNLLYAEKFRERGKYVLKEYKLNKDENLVCSVKKEIKVTVLKQYCLHWLMKDLPVNFVGYTTLSWYPHYICVNDEELQFKVLCDSNFGPMIIEYKNSIGSILHTNKKYIESVKILENFVCKKFYEISTSVRKEDNISEIRSKGIFRSVISDKEGLYKNRNFETMVNHSRPFYNIVKEEHENKHHVGLGLNNHDKVFLYRNNVIEKNIPFINKYGLECNEKGGLTPASSPVKLGDFFDNLRADRRWDDEKTVSFYSGAAREICAILEGKKGGNKSYNRKRRDSIRGGGIRFEVGRDRMDNMVKTTTSLTDNESSIQSKISLRNKSATVRKTKRTFNNSNNNINNHNNNNNNKNNNNNNNNTNTNTNNNNNNEQISVLNMIFPYIKEEDFQRSVYKTGEDWIEEAKGKKGLEVVRLTQFRRPVSNFGRLYKKYDALLKTYGSSPSIRCSSAYATAEETARREYLKSKALWVVPEDFRRVFGKRTTNERDKEDGIFKKEAGDVYKGSYLGYKFREVRKDKWIGKKDFVV